MLLSRNWSIKSVREASLAMLVDLILLWNVCVMICKVTRQRQTEVDKLSGSIHCVSKWCRIFSVIKSAFVKKRRGVISHKNAVTYSDNVSKMRFDFSVGFLRVRKNKDVA